MAEQREPNWSSGMKKDDAGRYVHGACRIDGDGFCVTHQSANWAECANAKMPPPSAAPSQPQPLRVALEYATSTLENEYRSDPTLQDLARSLRAALEAKEETGNGGH